MICSAHGKVHISSYLAGFQLGCAVTFELSNLVDSLLVDLDRFRQIREGVWQSEAASIQGQQMAGGKQTLSRKTLNFGLAIEVQQPAKLLVLGDLSLHGFVQANFGHSPGYTALVQGLEAYDGITLANLECALTMSENLNLEKITLHAEPQLLHELPRIDLFSLANNHISDAWEAGVRDTVNALSQHGKAFFGYGSDILEARKPVQIEKNDIRLGFLGYSCLSTNGDNYATPVRPGVCPVAAECFQTDIPRLKKTVDHVIVVLHWGEEHVHYPTPDQIAMAHRAIDLGASAIIGMHPHVIQGIERYRNGFICYSLGNFIFSDVECDLTREGNRVRFFQRLLRANKESIGVEFVIDKDRISLDTIKAYRLDRHFLPAEVPLSRLHTNLSKLNTRLAVYVKQNSDYLAKINGPQLTKRFSDGKYNNHYLLTPIHV